MKRFMLVDGSSLIFRAFYALKNLKTKDGVFTNAVYGFLTMFLKIRETYQPDYICVAFDRSGPTFRNGQFEDYKGTRQQTPGELSSQFGILKDLLEAFRIVYLDLQDYEADDICGTLAKQAVKEGMEAVLITGDRDFLQLVDENTRVVLTKKGLSEVEEYNLQRIKDEYGLEPHQLIEMKGLRGDPSDNIPGISGIGEKTALKLIQKYHTIEGLYEHIDEITQKKLKSNLLDNQQLAFLSRSLGEIHIQAPVDMDLENYRVKEPDRQQLLDKFEKLEFHSLINRYFSADQAEEDIVGVYHYQAIQQVDYDGLIEKIIKAGSFYFDLFFDGNNYINSEIVAMVIKLPTEKLSYFQYLEDQLNPFVEKFRVIFENNQIKKITHNIKEDMVLLRKHDVNLSEPYEDIMLLDYLMNPTRSNYNIDNIFKRYLNKTIFSHESIFGKGKAKLKFSEVEEEKIGIYGDMICSAYQEALPYLLSAIDERMMPKLYYEIELPLVRVLADMEFLGFSVDADYLQNLGNEWRREIETLEQSIYQHVGYSFNINSTKQLGDVLFDKLQLPIIKKTKTGYSTDVEVLEKLQGKHKIVDEILRYRSLKKLISTYIDGLLTTIKEDGKIHSTFLQYNAATGRISSIEPNLQNIPVKAEEGRQIRKAFISSPGYLLLDGDYSQIELRVLAHLANEKNMIRAFENDQDIHIKTASEVFHVEEKDVTPLQRSRAKAVNFGIVYGISDYGLSSNLNISRKEAKTYIDAYLDSYPNIKKYMEEIIQTGKNLGYVETIMHRRRYIPELESRNANIRGFGERIALNTPIQGSAADIIKVAMVQLYKALKKNGLESRIVLQVHDELILEVKENEIDKVKQILIDIMENAVSLSVPLKVDINIGKNWYEAK